MCFEVGEAAGVPIADGTFRASPGYFGDHARLEGHEDLFSRNGKAWLPIGCFLVRPGATIWFGAPDWDHFVLTPEARMFDHLRHGLRAADNLRLVGGDTTVCPGVDLTMTPGHTPGHLCVVVSSGRYRALLLGDAVVCPVQLDEPAWQSIGDVDPVLARRVRERLFRVLPGQGRWLD